MPSPSPRRVPPGPRSPDAHAARIAERVVDAWHSACGSDRLEIPLSTIAALTMLAPPHDKRAETANTLLDMTPEQFAGVVRVYWTQFIVMRPDLVNAAWPLAAVWVHPDERISTEDTHAAKVVIDAAIRADLLGLTGCDRREDTDLLGIVLTLLRPHSALQGRGQYYTPSAVALMMAEMLDIAENTSVCEPTVGTGGMFRAAAESMRARNRDPATVWWVGGDIDPYAIACLAVNAVLWRLGHKVVLGVGNSLTEDWIPKAIALRNEPRQLAASLHRDRQLLAAINGLFNHDAATTGTD